jgi:hypothetical protein
LKFIKSQAEIALNCAIIDRDGRSRCHRDLSITATFCAEPSPEALNMTSPRSSGRHPGQSQSGPGQSGRFGQPPVSPKSSSPRLAAAYNLEHEPLQAEHPVHEQRGFWLLRSFSGNFFAADRFAAAVLLVMVLGVILACVIFMSGSLFNMVQNFPRVDPADNLRQ